MPTKYQFLITNRETQGKRIIDEHGTTDIPTQQEPKLQFGRYKAISKITSPLDYQIYVDNSDRTEDFTDALHKPIEELGPSARFFRELFEEMLDSDKEALIYIHGFKHPFDRFMVTLNLIEEGYVHQDSKIGHIIGFSWPARAKVKDYEDDQTSAQISGKSLFQFLNTLQNFAAQAITNETQREAFLDRFNLMAASMGNRVVQYALDCFPVCHAKPLFNEVIHTGADVDIDAYENGHAMVRMLSLAKRIHVYYTMLDDILGLSVIKNGKERLGRLGKTMDTETFKNLVLVDVTALVSLARMLPSMCTTKDLLTYPVQHTYSTTIRAVQRDGVAIFNHIDTDKIPDRIPQFEDRWQLVYKPIAGFTQFT
ncbi:MAG: hypothetical protein QG625_3025 [Cyanobacteriota bacterium erpe_2018_sw_39hr_WHONDRS-SW48-000098_B_bin.30]|jgi:esterase/lipase superfamily enzyme|nr:alpha/beta hydrolase [Candidatus Obscuribacter sp.]MDQ5966869.1 hypothetical protein [Cyanobacteriota bacterium erpe_2018_sw_39hr_WHONDRS-SW48-000098_B_bin.30]